MFKLTGKTGKKMRAFRYSNLDFPIKTRENEFLPRLWATRRVGWLVEQIRSNGQNKELRDEIVELGTRYGIVTPYTSFLATDGSERRNGKSSFGAGNSPRRKLRSGRLLAQPTPSLSVAGERAVRDSKKAREQQDEISIAADKDDVIKTGLVKKVGVKTFYLESGVWVDSIFDEKAKVREVKIRFLSNEYFELVNKHKGLAKFLSIGEKVVVVWKDVVYRIIE